MIKRFPYLERILLHDLFAGIGWLPGVMHFVSFSLHRMKGLQAVFITLHVALLEGLGRCLPVERMERG